MNKDAKAIHLCCIVIKATTRGEGRQGLEVTLSCPNYDQLDHHVVYRKFYDHPADAVAVLQSALLEYSSSVNEGQPT